MSSGVVEKPVERTPRRALELLFGFCCVFGGSLLPLPGLAKLYVAAHVALGNWLLPQQLASNVTLVFAASDAEPWSLPLLVTPQLPQPPISVPIDARALLYLPTACFIALAVATPLGSWRKNARLLAMGLLVLEPLLLLLAALPIASFLGGTGPVRAFELSKATHTLLQILYRALVVPPGMAFAVPLFVWWILVARQGHASGFRTKPSKSANQ